MRTLAVLAGGLLAAVLAAAEPAAAVVEPTVWQGDLFITSVTSQCSQGSIVPNDFYRGVYRPFIAASLNNLKSPALSFVTGRSAFLLEAPGSTLSGKVIATSADIGGRATFDRVIAGAPVNLSITAPITTKTRVVGIAGTVGNFFNIAGCTVGVTGVLGLRP